MSPQTTNTFVKKGYFTLTQNSHPERDSTGCPSGKYSSYCCSSMSATSTDTCPSTWLDSQLGGGLAIRSSEIITDVSDDSLSVRANTGTSNCNAWAAGAAAPGVILVNVAGYWYNNN
jgi:hypothetical protein